MKYSLRSLMPKLRFRFSLRSLLVAIAVVAVFIQMYFWFFDYSPERDPLPWVPDFLMR